MCVLSVCVCVLLVCGTQNGVCCRARVPAGGLCGAHRSTQRTGPEVVSLARETYRFMYEALGPAVREPQRLVQQLGQLQEACVFLPRPTVSGRAKDGRRVGRVG
jgi:hypothetical protein